MKYLAPARPKLVPKSKILRIIEIWNIRHFKYSDFDVNVRKIIFVKYLPTVSPKLLSKLKMLRIY